MLLQEEASALLAAAQVAVVGLLVFVIAVMAWLMIRTGVGKSTLPKDQKSWLDYGNFYIVALGIAAVIIGFLVVLLYLDRFTGGAQALGFLTALFGAISALVGTYFVVKASSDARVGAEDIARAASVTPPPIITIEPPVATKKAGEAHNVTATVNSADGSPAANVPVTFTITAGPDMVHAGTNTTGAFGRANFQFTNNGSAGTDTIEAAALEGKGTATVTFEP